MDYDILNAAITALFGALGGATLVLALTSWLGKVWAGRILEQDRARYRREVDIDLAALRGRIERLQFIHKLQFETEFNAYRDLWSNLLVFRRTVLQLSPAVRILDKQEDRIAAYHQILMKAIEAYNTFSKTHHSHKPFIAQSVYDNTAKFIQSVEGLLQLDLDEAEKDVHEFVSAIAAEDEETFIAKVKAFRETASIADDVCNAIRERVVPIELTQPQRTT